MADPDLEAMLADAREAADPDVARKLARVEENVADLRAENEELRADREALHEELRETNRGTLELTAELEERYRKLFETAVEGIYTTTPDASRYVLANPAMADILGYESGDDLCEAVDSIEEDVFVASERYEEYDERLQSAGHLDDFEYRVRRADGEVRWVSDSTSELLTDDGELEGYQGGVVDITARKERERRLRRNRDELSVLNQLVRHDIRNDMTVILGWARTMEGHVDEEATDALERVIEASDHVITLTTIARDLVESMMDDSNPSLNPVDVSSVLRTEVEAQRASYPEATFHLPDELPPIQVRANRLLSSLFANLLYNAIQHNDTAEPVVTVSVEDREETVVVSVADDGPGVPDLQKETIFGENERGLESEGTGLGLYLVRVLVDQYEGDVWVEDNDPRGAVFVVELPKADAET